MTSNSITAIPQDSVRSICNGQVIVDLGTAVKELVENAVDASASHVTLTLHNYGADAIVVEDNGGGVLPANYEFLALKHHTSKLSSFESLNEVASSSFGFRGEALGSLCELASSFEVATRTADDSLGTILQYARNGSLKSQTSTARPVGTTVKISELFSPLPVRRTELLRTLKNQYNKTMSALYAYAVIHPQIKFTCITTAGTKSKRNVALTTRGNGKSREAISSVFGSKFLQTLVPFECWLGCQKHKDVETSVVDEYSEANISGWVSKAGTGVGRSNNDRQFCFINNRPVDIPKVTRLMNEVWRLFEMKHKPAYILNFMLPPGTFDVNVTPDKRQVLLIDEHRVLEALREATKSLWESSRYTYKVRGMEDHFKNNALVFPSQRTAKAPESTVDPAGEINVNVPTKERATENASVPTAVSTMEVLAHPGSATLTHGSRKTEEVRRMAEGAAIDHLGNNEEEPSSSKFNSHAKKLELHRNAKSPGAVGAIGVVKEKNKEIGKGKLGVNKKKNPRAKKSRGKMREESESEEESEEEESESEEEESESEEEESESGNDSEDSSNEEGRRNGGDSEVIESLPGTSTNEKADAPAPLLPSPSKEQFLSPSSPKFDENNVAPPCASKRELLDSLEGDQVQPKSKRYKQIPKSCSGGGKETVVPTWMDRVNTILAPFEDEGVLPSSSSVCKEKVGEPEEVPSSQGLVGLKKNDLRETGAVLCVDSKLYTPNNVEDYRKKCVAWTQERKRRRFTNSGKSSSNPFGGKKSMELDAEEDENIAVQKLERTIDKSGFGNMEIIGQFNLGFIVARLNGDLFILDQHACDEKSSYERLLATTVVHGQPLIRPLPVELSASEEMVVIEYREVFEQNGFRFRIDQDAAATRRVQLVAVPFSKKTQFGVEDVHELVSVITDRFGGRASDRKNKMPSLAECRLPKIMAMFASRACRFSIMIGRALPYSTMLKIVRRLQELDQPWNCPHGRPTMRHLVDLNDIKEAFS